MEVGLNELNCKLAALTSEYNNKSRELFGRQRDLDQVIRMIFEINSRLMHLNSQKASNTCQLDNLIHEVKTQQKRIQRKRAILARNYLPAQCSFSISCCKASKRKASPFCDETLCRSKVRQCNESYDVCAIIYGGTDGNKSPVLKGMSETVSRKFKASKVSQELVTSRNVVTQNLNKYFINTWQNIFYKSNENRSRSLSVYYSHNVMGKNKYRAVRKSNRNFLFQDKPLANYFPYKELAKFISSLDIGTLLHFSPHLIETYEAKNIPAGLYRDAKS